MGAGSSTEQRSPEQPPAGSDTPSELELSGHGPAAEAPGAAEEPADADPATKLPQKNGQLSAVSSIAEQGDDQVQEGNQDGQEEAVIVEDVGQRESEDVREKDRAKEMAANSAVVEDITKDGQQETPEIIEQLPASESNAEEIAQPTESQANDVGFKKVFKFVGFKFTVKKDKNEKSDTVQLLTVKKDEGEGAEATVGAGDHQEPPVETGESASKESELKQSIEKPEGAPKQAQSTEEIPLQAEAGHVAEEEANDEGEEKHDKEPTKSEESPISPVSSETTSSFKKFFTHGWAGWRKKTSFKKPKEDEPETSEKKKEQEAEIAGEEENEKAEESPSEQAPASEQQEPAEGTNEARLSADYEKVELPLEDQVGGLEGSSEEKCAPLATEVFDEKIEAHQEVVAEVHMSTMEKMAGEQEVGEEAKGDMEETGEPLPLGKPAETKEAPQEAQLAEELVKNKAVCVSGGDYTQLTDLSPDEKIMPKHPEGIISEVEMLSSQERIKVQGSPLKKLFSSSGLKKLSGKKQKGKRGGGGDEEPGEQQVQIESPESADEQKRDSSASSPEEPEEITCLEKGLLEARQEGEAEEGATSDGERKREGITPWASFKKMVTPKKRVRRPSESDKEEEVEKVKSATLSSTESTVSEMQEEVKTVGDEQKPEEPKRKVDTSVSWEALICVGSSKKRARKASSSDDEGGPKTVGEDGHRAEETSKDKEAGTDAVPASTQEPDQVQGSSSPEPAGSPSEGEGVSTWESFKRLVTPRKKSKSKMEEKTEDSGAEQLASDVEPSKEESWVSIKKFIPGRRKKRADGKQEQATAEEAGPTEITEDDPDVPAVVPLSEYDAVEREKMEVQQARESEEGPKLQGPVYVSEELSKTLVHTVTVTVIDGTRAVTSAEERSPSWISASVTPLEYAGDKATPSTEEVIVKETLIVTQTLPEGEDAHEEVIAEETPMITQTLPEGKDAHDDTVISEVEFTSEAVTAAETTEALHAEEVTEASGAEETTDMVSAVSQLTDSPDTTEEATPVQEVEGGMPDEEKQERQTQAVLQAVAEKVKGESTAPVPQTVQRAGALEKVDEVEEDSEVPAVEQERDVVLEEPVQGPEAEHSAQGSKIGQSTPEGLQEVYEVTLGVELKEQVTPCQAVEPQQLMEQAVAPDSSETLTDSETNGSTPLADSDTPDVTQQDEEAIESQDSKAVATDRQSQVTEVEASPTQKEGPSVPPQEGHGEKPGRDVPEPNEQELSVEAVPVLAKTEVGQEADHFDGEKVQDELCVEGLEVSVHTDGPDSQEKIVEVTHDGEVMGVPECEESESTEVQSLSPEQREMGTDVEKEKIETKPEEEMSEQHEPKMASPEHEEAHPQLIQTVDDDSERGKAVNGLEGSSSLPDQDKAGCIEVQVQSSEPPETQTAGPVKKVAKTVKISETDESLECVGAHLIPAEKSSEKGDYWTLQHGESTVPLGPESQAESVPGITSTTPENTLQSDLQKEISAPQKQRSDEDDEQVGGPDGEESAAMGEVLEAESEILELESKSSKLVQDIIQTAVDQVARTETAPKACASDLQAQVLVVQADSQGTQQMLDNEEESHHQVSAQDETLTATAQERLTLSDISQGVSKTSEKIDMLAVESTVVKDQQCEEVIVPLAAEGGGNGARPVPGEDCAKLGESVEKLPSESKDQKGHVADGPQHQSSAQAEVDASENLTKESPDTNGPKLTDEGDAWEAGVEEGKMPTESVKDIKPQTEEDLQEPEGDLEES